MKNTKLISLSLLLCLVIHSCKSKKSQEKQKALIICTEMPLKPDSTTNGLTGGVMSSKKWEWKPGSAREIRLCFLDGDELLIQKVMAKAKMWEPLAKIKFHQVNFMDKPDVKISFLGEGSWSRIGTDARGEDISMNLGWLTDTSTDQEFSRVVLHEFGHVLGFVHEHSLTQGNPIIWDKKKVKEYYQKKAPFWSDQEVEDNIFKRYENESLNGGEYDAQSIMIYGIPASLLKSKKEIKWNYQISINDKKTLFNAYL